MMSEKWLFSNHVDVEVVTTLLLQSVVIILNAVSALIRVTCYEVVQHSDYVKQTKRIFHFQCLKLYQISPQLCGC